MKTSIKTPSPSPKPVSVTIAMAVKSGQLYHLHLKALAQVKTEPFQLCLILGGKRDVALIWDSIEGKLRFLSDYRQLLDTLDTAGIPCLIGGIPNAHDSHAPADPSSSPLLNEQPSAFIEALTRRMNKELANLAADRALAFVSTDGLDALPDPRQRMNLLLDRAARAIQAADYNGGPLLVLCDPTTFAPSDVSPRLLADELSHRLRPTVSSLGAGKALP